STDCPLTPSDTHNTEQAQKTQALPSQQQIVDQVVLLERQLHAQAKHLKEQTRIIQDLQKQLSQNSTTAASYSTPRLELETAKEKTNNAGEVPREPGYVG
ncbi:hypothetical protein GcC1_015039, partial [Golovinomyces cichoracearum]